MIQKSFFDIIPFCIIFCVFTLYSVSHKSSVIHTPTKNFEINHTKYAFATLATPAFCMGAIALGHTLRVHHQDKYDMLCLVTPDVNQTWIDILSQWWRVIKVPNYKPFSSFRRSWAKLFLWDQVEYEKMVYFDTDMLVLQSLDELFEYPELSCAPDPGPPQICNSGVLVLKPEAGKSDHMKKTVKQKRLFQGIGDQSFINSYFGGFTPLHPKYNVPRVQSSGFGWAFDKNVSKVIHYVCKKPWKCGREGASYCGCGYPSFNSLWWKVWDEACSNHKCMETWEE
ncbi:glycosyl transferase [Tritrichomonas foetus]|uniref:Glycosyl transferase n=1 Tax=Tritrichomonas foetus TaxID=1144522 RepID=A0A1J4KG67_9EUKA|nr:glycosyl transferase [Tritrichomonas foetus]|eukprot:OHT08638.1 glycosyl transferase [Tritrichomonas foetus]